MKKIIKSALAVAIAAPMLLNTSCIEETMPTDGMTSGQLSSSAKATEALLWEMTAIYNNFNTLGFDRAYDWGYGSIMHIRDVMTEDMAIVSSDYDWYSAWERANYIGDNYMTAQFVWYYLWKVVLTTNNVFAACGTESADPTMSAYIGVASAFRASIYLDLARMYEFLPNAKTDGLSSTGNNVTGLTVPIVTEKTSEEMAKNNPRVSREEMAKFILSDLDRAEANISKSARLSKTMPDLAVVYGLKARYYMWLGQNIDGSVNTASYQKAAEYARLAITNSGCTPLTKADWTDPVKGFNDPSSRSWMWCMQTVKEDRVVTSGILNWTSWMSNEASFGYAAAGPMSMIYKKTYDRINDKDFRKLSWKAPSNSALKDKVTYLDAAAAEKFANYTSVKFRPGGGNTDDYLVAAVGGVPLMRVEEMYFIEAEATAHINPAQGRQLCEDFMRTYRYESYQMSPTADVVDEIVFQKRVELWGEGQIFYDLKRLGMSVDRKCSGTNFYTDAQLVSEGRPAWVNFVIVQSEGNANRGLEGWNNPNFDGMYQ